MTLIQFTERYINTRVDYDKKYGSQCVDLFRQYCKDVLEIPHTGSVEGACELANNYAGMPLERKYFHLIKKPYMFGDVVVWDKTSTNKYGHVAIFLGENPDGLIVLEQDGFKQNGCKLRLRSRNNIAGVLSPIDRSNI